MKKLSENIDDLYYGDEPDYTDELNAIEDGGFEEMYPEDYKNSEKADYIHKSAAERGMSDLAYVNQEEFFDEIIDSDPQDGPYIVDIEESDGYSEFICDDNGNPNLEDARPIYDKLVSGKEKGLYGLDCKDNPYEALSDVIEGYDMMVDDAQLGRHSLKGALKMLYKFKDNPNCPKTKVYFNALANYAEQVNDIAKDIGALDLIIDIPGKFEESTKRSIKEAFVEGPGLSDTARVHRIKIKKVLDKNSIDYDEHSQTLAYDVPIVTGNYVGWSDIEAVKDFFAENGLKVGFATVDGLYYYGILQLEDEEVEAYLNQYNESKDENDDDWSDLKADILVCWY